MAELLDRDRGRRGSNALKRQAVFGLVKPPAVGNEVPDLRLLALLSGKQAIDMGISRLPIP